MTNEEAIKELIRFFRIYAPEPFPSFMHKAIEALEKQIPKKLDDGRCPFCGKFEISSDMGYDYPFCHDCGQALDWRKE